MTLEQDRMNITFVGPLVSWEPLVVNSVDTIEEDDDNNEPVHCDDIVREDEILQELLNETNEYSRIVAPLLISSSVHYRIPTKVSTYHHRTQYSGLPLHTWAVQYANLGLDLFL